MTTQENTPWQKSTFSDPNGSCFQLRRNAGMIELRDTKAGPDAPVQRYTEAEALAFIEGVKAGEFDHLVN
ncbi:DUF397 domain-containing protein [Kineosporia sp. J2-2]|uniref:DUF397 domain-containing protein n=1 Tax=Kineosporia corallincola TaxID=2835133 RepID=A0ABS5TTS3_9ACTN|nr:DUF397 domain-containing protein [Kineosporia corallincola]MBT0774194.1 DUF397 domain-containing protein [Kineosporia corallincola]